MLFSRYINFVSLMAFDDKCTLHSYVYRLVYIVDRLVIGRDRVESQQSTLGTGGDPLWRYLYVWPSWSPESNISFPPPPSSCRLLNTLMVKISQILFFLRQVIHFATANFRLPETFPSNSYQPVSTPTFSEIYS